MIPFPVQFHHAEPIESLDDSHLNHTTERKQDDSPDTGASARRHSAASILDRGNRYRLYGGADTSSRRRSADAVFMSAANQASFAHNHKMRSRFLKAFDATQRQLQGERTQTAPDASLHPESLLVISENANNHLSHRYEEQGVGVTKTFFATDAQEIAARTADNAKLWDWTRDPLPFAKTQYDLVIGRSMVCACEDIHHYERLPGSGDVVAVATCGGIDKANQEMVLREVAGLLSDNPKAKAYLTLSPRLHYQGIEDRSLQRQKAAEFWEETVHRLNSDNGNPFTILPIVVTEDNIPVLNVDDGRPAQDGAFEKKGDFFGFKIKHRKAEGGRR